MEDLLNALTHGAGLVLSIGGLLLLVGRAVMHGTMWHVIACTIYGVTLVLLYAASTAYHAADSTLRKEKLRVVDQICIYLLIAGTYTPFLLVSIRGGWGFSLLVVVWGLALLGIGLKIFVPEKSLLWTTLTYLGLGWLAVVAVVPLSKGVETGGLMWVALGGLAYSLGAVFLGLRRMPFHHTVWHLFVLLGSVCHFVAVTLYVLPRA